MRLCRGLLNDDESDPRADDSLGYGSDNTGAVTLSLKREPQYLSKSSKVLFGKRIARLRLYLSRTE